MIGRSGECARSMRPVLSENSIDVPASRVLDESEVRAALAVCPAAACLCYAGLMHPLSHPAELSLRTFCTFAREFSPSTAKANHRQL